MPEGLILKGVGGFYQVESDCGLFECRVRGIFRKRGLTPFPGDFVVFTITDKDAGEGWIEEIKKRKSFLRRPTIVNVDRLAVVLAATDPVPDYLLADKIMISAQQNAMDIIVIINKIDLVDSTTLTEMKNIYRGTGFSIIPMSKVTMEGYSSLHEKLRGHRTVFAGQSGVGKSTILNHVINSWVMETGEISAKIQRGKHTTRHVQLLPLDCGGYVADTPGFHTFELEELKYDELMWMYPEFEKYHGKCRFHGCSHMNEPQCAVKEAVETEQIPKKRYDCYCRLYEELKNQYENRYK